MLGMSKKKKKKLCQRHMKNGTRMDTILLKV